MKYKQLTWTELLAVATLISVCNVTTAQSLETTSASQINQIAATDEPGTLYLSNGDYLPGQFVAHDEPGQIRWKTDLFLDPATFEFSGLDRVVFGKIAKPKPTAPREAQRAPANPVAAALGQFSKLFSGNGRKKTQPVKKMKEPVELGTRVQTLDGNVIYGDVRTMDADWLSMRSLRHGDFRISSASVERMDGFTEELAGLFDLVRGFQNAVSVGRKQKIDDWKLAEGSLTTTTAGGNLFVRSTHKGPVQIELVVSASNGRPDFLVTLGVTNNTQSIRKGFSVETWGDRLVAHRQVKDELKHVELATPPNATQKSIRLRLFLDPANGRLLVYSQSKLLGEFNDDPAVNSSVLLRNNGPDLVVHQFRAKSWNGRSAPLAPSEQHIVQMVDGDQVRGTISAISDGKLTLETAAEPQEIALQEIDQVVFSQRDEIGNSRRQTPSQENVRIDYLDGSVVSGQYVRTTVDGLIVNVANVDSPFQAGWANMGHVQWLSAARTIPDDRSMGVIERTSHRIHGHVFPADGSVKWKPYGSSIPVTVDLQSKSKVTFDSVAASTIDPGLTDELHLINGDTIPCRLLSVDDQSVRVQFVDGTKTAVARDVFKAIRRRPNESYVYEGIQESEIWHASKNDSRAFSLRDGVLEFKRPIFLSRNVDLPERACISFDAEWTGDCVLLAGFGADEAHEAVRRLDGNAGYSSKMREEEAKRRRDFFGEVSLTRAGKALTARGYLRSSGLTGQAFANNNMGFVSRSNQTTATLAMGESPRANIDIFIDRPRRQYAVVANGKTLHSWKESARLDGKAIYLGFQSSAAAAPNFGVGATVKQSEAKPGIVRISNLRVARWPGAVPGDRMNRLLTRRLGARPKATTHVLRAFNGDSLRGQLVSVQNNTVMFKARLDTISIPLDKVAEIIALRPVTAEAGKAPFSLELHGSGSVVIKPVQVTNDLMVGHSPHIGRIAVPWRVVSQMNVAGSFKRSLSNLISWKLKEPPKLPELLNGGGPSTPVASPMVGKPAPQLDLEMLDGTQVSLADLRGKTVVLDFWATWCGPCVASLPRVMEVAAGFDEDVVLIAVNQQEDPEVVNAFLASHDWENLAVALDRKMVGAKSYRVEGIPHTVIIDPEGVVRSVHVGASSDLATALSKEIEATLTPVQ